MTDGTGSAGLPADPGWVVRQLPERQLREVLLIMCDRDPGAVAAAIGDALAGDHPAEGDRW